MSNDKSILLEMKNITKEFPGVRALDGVSFTLKKGSVHALMGENGAGKSTLMKCLFGINSIDSGEIFLEGEQVNFKNPNDALSHGVAMVHQELNQATKRNVMDNIWLGRYPTKLGFVTSEKEMYRRTKEIFDDLGIHTDPRRIMSTMSVAERQMAEIAKAVSYDAKVIVLDEPTSSLSDREVEHLFEIIGKLKKRGCGIIYISHKMDEILRISDEITVMRDGRHIATESAENMTVNKIIHLMVGRELTELFPEKTNEPGKVILRVEGLSSKHNHVREVSFEIREGEVVGFAGLAGAGRTEVIENIFGISERESGKIFLDGREIKNRNPREAIKNGFALVTEERRATGIFGNLDICDNTTVARLKGYVRYGLISERERKKDTEKTIRSMNVKTASQRTHIKLLSGGNQQKVILGRWMLTEPRILMLDEPTRGIDVGAKFEIYKLIDSLAASGKAIIAVSSELPELLGICDRIYVMSSGRIAGVVKARETSQEEIMTLASKFM